MPKLPDFTALGERPTPTLPRRTPMVAGFRATTGMEDEGARALGTAGAELQTAANAAFEAKERQDTMVAEDAYNKLQAKRLELEFDPKQGFRNVQGLPAIGQKFFQDNVAKLGAYTDQLAEGLDPSQREKFQRRAAVAGLQYRSALLQHQSQEMNTFNDNTEANGVAIRLRNISLNWHNDVAFATGLAEINGLLDARGMRKNLPPEQTAMEKAKALDDAWGSRIKAAMIDDPLRAEEMFKQHRPELGPQSQIILAHEIKQSVLPVRAKNAASAILDTPSGDALGTTLQSSMARRDTQAKIGTWEAQARQKAAEDFPNDPVAADMYAHEVKGRVASVLQAQEGLQRQAQGLVIEAARGGNNQPPPLTMAELQKDPKVREALSLMDPLAINGVVALLDHNQRTANGEFVRGNPALVKELHDRMFLDENDPKKLRSVTELVPYFARGLNQSQYDWLKREFETSRNPEGNAFLRDKTRFVNRGVARMKEGILGQTLASTQPEVLNDAGFNFTLAVDKRIDELRKEGKDPRNVLFDPKSPEYVLRPGYVESFMPSARQGVAAAAAKTAAGSYEAGKTYPFKQGTFRFKGGDANVATNWEPVK